MTVPSWIAFVIVSLGVFRLVRLAGWDDLTIGLRHRVTGVGDDQHHQIAAMVDAFRQGGWDPWDPEDRQQVNDALRETDPDSGLPADAPPIPIGPRRFYLSKMIRCPWCVGFWISLLVWLLWLAWPSVVVGLNVPLAFSAIVGLVSKNLDP